MDRFQDRLAAFFCVLRRLHRDLLGLDGVVGVLPDVGGHLFHAGRGFLGRRRLLACTLRHLLRARREFLASLRHVVGGGFHLGNHLPQLVQHLAHGGKQHTGFIPGGRTDLESEIAGRQPVGGFDSLLQRQPYAAGNNQAEGYGDQHGYQRDAEQHRDDGARLLVDFSACRVHRFVGVLCQFHRGRFHEVRLVLEIGYGTVCRFRVLDLAAFYGIEDLAETCLVKRQVLLDRLYLFLVVRIDLEFLHIGHPFRRLVGLFGPFLMVLIDFLGVMDVEEDVLLVAPHAQDVGPGPGGVLGEPSLGTEHSVRGVLYIFYAPIACAGHCYQQKQHQCEAK